LTTIDGTINMKQKIFDMLMKINWDVSFAVYGIDENNRLHGYKIDDDFDIDEVVTKSEYDQYLISLASYSLSITRVINHGKLLGYALTKNNSRFFRENHYGLLSTIEEAIDALEDCKKKIFEKS
jgi:hypothetical protein